MRRDEPATPAVDLESEAVRRWAVAAASLPARAPAPDPAPARRPRVTRPATTRWGWVVAASPVVVSGIAIALGAAAGGFSRVELVGIAVLSGAALTVVADRDRSQLRSRGFVAAPTPWLVGDAPRLPVRAGEAHTRRLPLVSHVVGPHRIRRRRGACDP